MKQRSHWNPASLIALVLTLLTLAGCARFYRRPAPLSEDRQLEITRSFEKFIVDVSVCQDLEADAMLTFRSWFLNGAIPGIFQTKRPASLKFVGTNPLGQPLAVFAMNGSSFQYLDIAEKTAKEGNVTAVAFRKKLPPGVEPGSFFSWFTGWPGELQGKQPTGIERDSDGAYWLSFREEKNALSERFLYDPQKNILLARQVVDAKKKKLLEARYSEHQDGLCHPPTRVSIAPLTGGGSLEITFKTTDVNRGISADEFQISIPAAFERIRLE